MKGQAARDRDTERHRKRNQRRTMNKVLPLPPDLPSELLVGSYNVHKGVGTDMRRDPGRIVEVIREIGGDIVALQEVDRRFGDRKGILDLEYLAETTGLSPVTLEGRLGRLSH